MMTTIKPSEITPEHVYLSRRDFVRGISAVALGNLVLGACGRRGVVTPAAPGQSISKGPAAGQTPHAGASTDELGAPLTDYQDITTYNNFYEFSLTKEGPAQLAKDFVTSPWAVKVGGLVTNPKTYDVDDLRRRFGQQERIYRLRCVEAWSMVIPWLGFPLAKLLQEVEPTSAAQYVRFETLYDPKQMPGVNSIDLHWPYVEGLRLDEAMNDLTLLATGIYGIPLLPQNGAPIRLVVPWKYGFKSIKSIVKIDLVADRPVTTWPEMAPNEYDFYANVDPTVPHPRWSQASEQRIGETGRIATLPYNGYADQVASLYADSSGGARPRGVR
jgi:methionine sulfoxide reductase catalytic subunit